MLAGRRSWLWCSLLLAAAFAAAPAGAQEVGSAARAGQKVLAFDGPATTSRLAATVRRAMRGDGFETVVTHCDPARAGRTTCRVRALEGGLVWRGTANVTRKGDRATVRYFVEGS